jgi:protein-ribulosamine 3-kinase
MASNEQLAAFISGATGNRFRVEAVHAVGGGSRWRTLRIDNVDGGTPAQVFAKVGAAGVGEVFEAERDGLELLRGVNSALRIPRVLACGKVAGDSVLILEWIDLEPLGAASGAAFGTALAGLHRTTAERFGLERDNFIGASVQINRQEGDWVTFWQHQRLLYQLQLAEMNRYPSRLISRGERLVADCGAFFQSYRPVASLLHGDTWAGNAAADTAGMPVTFDPAVYYGDREADVAMTELFGGYPGDFYAAYRNAWPLDAGYATRKQLYNLYHILNHANLFAGDYVRQSERMIEALLAEIGG